MREFREADGSAVYLKVIVIMLAVNIGAGIVALSAQAAGAGDLLDNSLFNYAVMTLFQLVNISVVVLHLKKRRQRLDCPLLRKPPLTATLLALPAAVLCLFGFFGLASAFQMFLDKIGFVGQAGIPFDGSGDIAMGVIVTVILAPVGEELVYRGALLSGLKKGYPVWAAVALSGLAFSFMHMNPEQTVYQFLLGCTCALLTLCSGSLVPAVVVHAGSNLIAVLMEVTPFGDAFYRFIDWLSPNAGLTALWIGLSAVIAAAGIGGIAWLMKRRATAPAAVTYEPPPEGLPEGGIMGRQTGKILYWFAWAVTAFMWIMVFIQGMTV